MKKIVQKRGWHYEKLADVLPGIEGASLNRAGRDAQVIATVIDMVAKFSGMLGFAHVEPKVEIRDNFGSLWLGQCEWHPKNPTTTTIRLQRSILGDARSLARIVAHETIHHAVALTIAPAVMNPAHPQHREVLRERKVGKGHGRYFEVGMERINKEMGKDFVTKVSDSEVVVSSTKEIFLLIVPLGLLRPRTLHEESKRGRSAQDIQALIDDGYDTGLGYSFSLKHPLAVNPRGVAGFIADTGAKIVKVAAKSSAQWAGGRITDKRVAISEPRAEEKRELLRKYYGAGAYRTAEQIRNDMVDGVHVWVGR